jgi:acyl-CoA-binding protein
MVAESAEFKKAVEDSRSLSQTPTNDELLEVRICCSHAKHRSIHS